MFRDSPVPSRGATWVVGLGLCGALVIATGMNLWLLWETRKEQSAIQAIVQGGNQQDIRRLGSLPADLPWQLVFTTVVMLVLVVATVALALILPAYLRNLTRLSDARTLARDVLSSIDYGLVTTDAAGRITSANRQAEELLGISAAAMGELLVDVLPHATPLEEICRRVRKENESAHDCQFVWDGHGRQRTLRVDCHELKSVNTQQSGLVLLVRDVTERVLLEQRMTRMERFISLGTLAAGLHHEIKNPLTALSLHVQLLDEAFGDQADQPTLENLSVLKTEVTRIAGVLESFRSFASSEQLQTMPLHVADVISRTFNLLAPLAGERQIAFAVESGEPLPVVMGDPARLEQVFLNLAMNAIESMPRGGRLTMRAFRREEQLVVDVADTGCGIPDDIREHILDPYFTTKNSGSGMGLALCDKIVRQHGGQLTFDTGPAGTVFHVVLPVAHVE